MKRPREEASESPVEKVSKKAKEEKDAAKAASDKGDAACTVNGASKDSTASAEATAVDQVAEGNGMVVAEENEKGSEEAKEGKGGEELNEAEKKDGDSNATNKLTGTAEKSVGSAKRGRKVKAKRPVVRKEGTTPRRAPRKEPVPPVVEEVWREAFPVGTEWEQFDKVYGVDWDFSNLDEAFEPEGLLYNKRVYMFGCSEPQMVNWNGEMKMVVVPAVVAVVAPFPPSEKLGIKSVQRTVEDIVSMKDMKMDWVPLLQDDTKGSRLKDFNVNIFVLKCTQRKAGLRQLKEERVKQFEYCLPYVFLPHMQEAEEVDKVVSIMYPFGEGDGAPPPLLCDYDWEFDEPEEFADTKISEEVLPADHKEKFMEFVKSAVKEAKAKAREEREQKKKAINDLSDDVKEGLKNMKFYKFYPKASEDTPDITPVKEAYINRYYGKAHQVF